VVRAAVVSAAIGVLVAACAIVAAPSSSPAHAECERQGGVWRAALGMCERPGGGGGGGSM
jgi:hypothetical protein